MQTIAMEFESREHLNEAVEKLWGAGKVSGELAVKPLSGGRWRLDLLSEETLKDKLLEKLPGKILGAKAVDADAVEDADDEAEEGADDDAEADADASDDS